MTLKNLSVEFTLGTPYKTDPGTGEVSEYVTTLEGSTLVTKKVDTGDVISKREFNDSGFVQTYYSKSVTATRTFKKA